VIGCGACRHRDRNATSQRTSDRQTKVVRLETHLQDLWEGFHDTCVVIAVDLYDIDQSDLSFGAFTESHKNWGKFLQTEMMSMEGPLIGEPGHSPRPHVVRGLRSGPGVHSSLQKP
jgi:hypothetical protein